MANSKYGYVRSFEQPDTLLANTWIVVRIDGRGFSKFTTKYKFVKPNDRPALDLMNAAAEAVMKELPDLVLAYGNSDEFSFVFHKDCALFERRASKLTTTIVSTFTSYYVYLWLNYFPDKPLTPPLPSFDGRAVCYPSDFNLRDYMSWRQVDCHINNLYNTTFWTLVQQGGMEAREAEQRLKGTVSSDKNEILFKEFGINYNKEPDCFRKGTVMCRDFFPTAPTAKSEAPPTLTSRSSPPLAEPQPKRAHSHIISRPIERTNPYLQDLIASPGSPDQGPGRTFLSTTSTPSPPPSPSMMTRAAFTNPLQSRPISPRTSTYPPPSAMPISPPSTVTSPYGNLILPHTKQLLPSLMPLPLSPLTLRPSTKPPTSLDAPNPTTRTNFSPTSPPADFPSAFQISGYSQKKATPTHRPTSHSASASMSTPGLSLTHHNGLQQRSPSQPQIPTYLASSNPATNVSPAIPLRMSSIPANSKPRKLSLRGHRSTSTLKPTRQSLEEMERLLSSSNHSSGSSTPRKVSPPLRTNKVLPNPPLNREEELRVRERVKRNSDSSQQAWTNFDTASESFSQQQCINEIDSKNGRAWPNTGVTHPGIAELPAVPARQSSSHHTRLHSAPTSSSMYSPFQRPDVTALLRTATVSKIQLVPSADTIAPTAPRAASPISKSAKLSPITANAPCPVKDFSCRPPADTKTKQPPKEKPKVGEKKPKDVESGSAVAAADGRPVQMSRTQKDKDRKKRTKARILVEHVDLIKDEFWEKRPWILSGKTG